MIVKRITIHFINKEQGNSQVTNIDKSESIIEITDNVGKLAERLNDSFRKNEKVLKTEFTTPSNVFQEKMEDYCSEPSDILFMDFTSNSIDRLGDLLTNVPLATGGYFVYMDYVAMEVEYMAVFLVRDSEEVIFKKEPGSTNFGVDTEIIINTKKLAMAARVELNSYVNGELRYLHFIHQQANVSGYFTDWVEAQIADRSKEDTLNLLTLINNLKEEDMPLIPGTDEQYSISEFRNILYDNIQSQGRLVRIVDMSNTFWGSKEFLINKIEELGITIDMEFQATERTLKGLKKYDIRSGRLRVTFTRDDVVSGRISRGDKSDQILIESQELRAKFDELDD